jgi:hypothetical protein
MSYLFLLVLLIGNYGNDQSNKNTAYSEYKKNSAFQPTALSHIVAANPAQKNSEQNETAPSRNSPPLSRYELISLLLTAAYVGVSIAMWRAIKYQVKMSHRPQLAAISTGEPVAELLDPKEPRIKIAVKNVGGTAAYDVRYSTWIELLNFPFVDFSPRADHVQHMEPAAIYPNHKPLVINIPIRAGFTPNERADILQNRRYVCIRVHVTYKDSFSWRRRHANFGFYMMAQGLGFLPKYNDGD